MSDFICDPRCQCISNATGIQLCSNCINDRRKNIDPNTPDDYVWPWPVVYPDTYPLRVQQDK